MGWVVTIKLNQIRLNWELGTATKKDIQKVREAIQVLTAKFGKIIIKLDKA